MSDMKDHLKWMGGMHFECDMRGFKIQMDTAHEMGGTNLGPTPKELLMHAMAGCTAMDVVSILKKMHQDLQTLEMNVEVDKNKTHPIHFVKAKLTYILKGNLDTEKAKQAVEHSLTKYCGVNYMISKICKISYVVNVNGEDTATGFASFIDPQD